MVKKNKKNLPAHGHNSDELVQDYVKRLIQNNDKAVVLRGEAKEILNAAKNDGFLKTALRNTVKKLKCTEEQRQAQAEIDSETARITALCIDLPLFDKKAAY